MGSLCDGPLPRGAATGKGQLRGIKRPPGRISLTHRFIGILPSDKCLVPETSTSKPNIRQERTHPRLRLSVKPWQSEARTNRDSPDAGHAPGPALQLHRVGDIPSINKMVLKACASVAQLVKSSLPNKSDGHKALPQKDPSSMDPYSHSLAPTTHSAASRVPIGSRRKGHIDRIFSTAFVVSAAVASTGSSLLSGMAEAGRGRRDRCP